MTAPLCDKSDRGSCFPPSMATPLSAFPESAVQEDAHTGYRTDSGDGPLFAELCKAIGYDSDSDSDDSEFYFSSTPSSWSTGSARSKRTWDDKSDSNNEPSQKRPRRGQPSPVSSHSSLQRCLPRHLDDAFLNFCRRPGTAFVDKTQCIRQIPNKFRSLLLRPPRFGKTVFLSTLMDYYDVCRVRTFDRHFGSLAVVTRDPQSIPGHSQHLCLFIDLADVGVYSDTAIANSILRVAKMFLFTYASELQVRAPSGFFKDENDDVFARLFELVASRGYTLFVAIDNYDVPLMHPTTHDTLASVGDIERTVDEYVWRPLLAGSHVIDKLLVAGAFPVKYPALESMDLKSLPGFQLSCGFTEQETLDLARSVLGITPDMAEIQRSCGGYIFSATEPDRAAAQPLLHPQRVINRLSSLSSQHLHPDDAEDVSYHLLSDILRLRLVPSSNVPGAVTPEDLIGLLAAGAVENNERDTTLPFNAAALTLYHAGALTYDHQMANTLRVANDAVLSQMYAAVRADFTERYDLGTEFGAKLRGHSFSDNTTLLATVLSRILQDLSQVSFGRRYEPTIHGFLELVLRSAVAWSDTKVDPSILPAIKRIIKVPGFPINLEDVWELSTLTLQGIWRAAYPNDGDTPTVEALRTLHKELVQDDEEQLLARPCAVWSSSLHAMEMRLVGDFFDAEPEYPQFLAVGGARVLLRQRPRDSAPIPNDSGL
ncbi:hypothetical protein B0H15DRAFT_180402 [Mycena belliarum]|uniref:AAA-ATPase-like domain-containing protein n=1 Tax=Mycena belliarum TaxID=1033014 RepID=A0AAD6U5L7_9AGAR|nr:hypothetical protein B0H15DRAFT_180402 [Mycena belliae]